MIAKQGIDHVGWIKICRRCDLIGGKISQLSAVLIFVKLASEEDERAQETQVVIGSPEEQSEFLLEYDEFVDSLAACAEVLYDRKKGPTLDQCLNRLMDVNILPNYDLLLKKGRDN